MDRNYEDKIQADVNAIFTLMEQRVDEKQMLLIHSAYRTRQSLRIKTKGASRVSLTSVIL